MDKNRLIVIGAVLGMVVVVVLGWIVGVQPQLEAAASADHGRATVESQNAASAVSLAKLKKDYTKIDELKKQRTELQTAIPQGTDMSPFIDELHALEVTHGVKLTSITITDGQAYEPPKKAAAPAATATPAPAAPAASDQTVATSPKITKDNFTVMPIQLALSGKYSNVLNYVHGLQAGTRLVLVTSFSSTASKDSSGGATGDETPAPSDEVDATIGGYVYVLTTDKDTDTAAK